MTHNNESLGKKYCYSKKCSLLESPEKTFDTTVNREANLAKQMAEIWDVKRINFGPVIDIGHCVVHTHNMLRNNHTVVDLYICLSYMGILTLWSRGITVAVGFSVVSNFLFNLKF